MKKLVLILLVLAVVAALGGWFEPTHTVRGWINGEPFYQDRAASWWGQKLLSQEPTAQVEFPKRLKEGGADSIPVLKNLLSASEPEVRWQAASLLGKMGPTAASTAEAISALLTDADSHVRQ